MQYVVYLFEFATSFAFLACCCSYFIFVHGVVLPYHESSQGIHSIMFYILHNDVLYYRISKRITLHIISYHSVTHIIV